MTVKASRIGRYWLLLAAGVSLSGCLGRTEPVPFIVGHVSTLSGPVRSAGEHAVRGIRLALEDLEKDPAKGPGRPVLVRHTDTRGDLQAYESEAVRLVAVNKAVALMGGSTAAEVERLQRAGVPVVSPAGMRTRSMGDLVFLTGLSPALEGQVLARFAVQDRAATTAVILADERCDEALQLADPFAQAFAVAVLKQKPGSAAAQPEVWRFGKEARMDALAARVRERKPGVLLFAGRAGELCELVGKLKLPEMTILWSGDGKIDTPGVIFRATAFVADLDMPAAKAFGEQYRKTFHEEPDVPAALAYEGLRLLIEGLRDLDDPAQLKDRLASIKDFPGLAGSLSFDSDRQLRRVALVVRLENGRESLVKRVTPEP